VFLHRAAWGIPSCDSDRREVRSPSRSPSAPRYIYGCVPRWNPLPRFLSLTGYEVVSDNEAERTPKTGNEMAVEDSEGARVITDKARRNIQKNERMTFLDREFADLGELLIERAPDGSPIEFTPQARYGKVSSLHRYGTGPFCKFRVTGLHGSSGVYLLISDGTVVYVGRAVNLQKRNLNGIRQHLAEELLSGGTADEL
jgi:hypothetical protein